MKIIEFEPKYQQLYFCCLEEWSEEMEEGVPIKQEWYEKYKDLGLRVKLGVADDNTIAGMIQYLPIEHSFAEGNNLYIILCIWIHGHSQGIGNYQKQGLGKNLLLAAEEDTKKLGAKGLVAWGMVLPFFMKASWFRKHGYKKVDRQGIQALLWKPFTEDAKPPKLLKQKKKPPLIPGKVHVSSFYNGWCTAQNAVHTRAKQAASEFPETVVFTGINTSERETFLDWGLTDALFIDKKEIRTGPPPSYEKIKKLIEKKVKKLK